MALRRIFREAVLRAIVVMHGTERDVERIALGHFSLDEKRAGEIIAATVGSTEFGKYLRENGSFFDDLTHSGKSLLARYITVRADDGEIDIECTVSNAEVLHVLEETVMYLSILVFVGLQFFEMDAELSLADDLMTEYRKAMAQ
jgi:hypothetical protein